jgi:hypothetical protein
MHSRSGAVEMEVVLRCSERAETDSGGMPELLKGREAGAAVSLPRAAPATVSWVSPAAGQSDHGCGIESWVELTLLIGVGDLTA